VELLLVRSVAWPDIHQQERWMALLEHTALQLGAQTASVRADSPLAIGVEEGADLSLVLRGRDEVTLVHQAERLAAAARAMGAGGVELSSAGLRPSVLIEPNDLFLSERGISLAALRSQVAGSIQSYELEAFRPIWKGESASPYTLPIRLRAPLAEQSGGDLATIPISDSRELGHLSTITSDRRAAVIEHRNGLTATTISIQRLPEGSDSARFLSDLREFAPLPASVELLDQGVDERASSGMQLLLMSFALSVFLVFVVMTAQFESLIQPLLVMISVPLSVAGALLMLWLSGSGIDGMSAIGMIILAGIAVNNAIVLVTTYNLRPESDDHLAARRATVLRLRPILMTTCTTVCSLIPMLLGSDPMSAVRQPLALALIGGLVFSAVLVVIALPALLVLVRRPRLAEKEQPHGASTFSAPALASP
jgi:HAE1 family hydrophobic/amphiphilic exporter-1